MTGTPPVAAVLRQAVAHLEALSDEVGLLEHADHRTPRRKHGHCVDDNARAVVVTGHLLDLSQDAVAVHERCLAFVLAAQSGDGRFHNRPGIRRRWADRAGTGDHWGRALWALGQVAASPSHPQAAPARRAFLRAARHRSPHPRAMAYAALGAAALLGGAPSPDEATAARRLLLDAVATIGGPRPGAHGWIWPAARLTYGNARLPDALIAAGTALRHAGAVADGLTLLRWLAGVETRGAHLSFVPTRGWAPGAPRPAFDQQPIEAWAMADAARRALQATCDHAWWTLVERCGDWFAGRNDVGVALYDPNGGGGCDGLTPTGRNENRGAESTLALIATLQHQHEAALVTR